MNSQPKSIDEPVVLTHESLTITSTSPLGNPNLDPNTGPVLQGYDVVSYYQDNKMGPMKGSTKHQALYEGYTFLFHSPENMEVFLAKPEAYVPEFGGFCTYGVAEETYWTASTLAAPANPLVYLILEGHLHVFRSLNVLDWFQKLGVEKGVAEGKVNWAKLYGELPVFNTGIFYNSF
uniref:YHS domain-containing protein n=1 Tax=Fibrocapsa japonica TaxID=94617 RepID=A0A7S2V1S8_9STRA